MSQINMCIYCTEENNKFPIVKECLQSLSDTVDFGRHKVILINQNSIPEATAWLQEYRNKYKMTLITLSENIGTARGINIGLKMRQPGVMQIKADDDLTWDVSGWVEELEIYCKDDIGVLGLKRKEVWQRPDHPDERYRTKMEGRLEICDDIFGTCTAYNPAMLDKVGLLNQCSPLYGGDDVLISVRSLCAGFRNAFLPHVPIKNIDLVKTKYTKWKQLEAAKYMDDLHNMCNLYQSGKLSYCYNEYDE